MNQRDLKQRNQIEDVVKEEEVEEEVVVNEVIEEVQLLNNEMINILVKKIRRLMQHRVQNKKDPP